MKIFFVIIVLVLLQNCSFDNKTGIWKNENLITNKKDNLFKDFEKLSITDEVFDKIIPINTNFKFKITPEINNLYWRDIFYNKNNNSDNFSYTNLNKLILRTKKISKHEINEYILYDDNYLLLNDSKGNLISYSIEKNIIQNKFNFYKKKHKKIKKKLNFIVEKNIIYTSDNLGYLYAYNYKTNKILWAKNYKVPFRSNLKIINNKLIAVNQNNNLFFFDKKTGNILTTIPTEETIVKNTFTNNLSSNKENIFFLNTYGTLYSINANTLKINWFINLNQTLDLTPSNLFMSNPIVNNEEKIIIATNQFTYIIDSKTGFTLNKINFNSSIKPIILNNFLFLINNNSQLISLNLDNGKIIYSYDINQKISNFLKTKKKKIISKNMIILSDKIFIFLKNSYILKFDIYGNLEQIDKLPKKLNSNPIFIDKSLIYVDFKNKVSVVN
jgi:outer membrane protein assembly factor BamB